MVIAAPLQRITVLLGLWALVLQLSPATLRAQRQPVQVGLSYFGASYVGDLNKTVEVLHRYYPGVNVSLQFDSPRRLYMQLNIGGGSFIAQDRTLGPSELGIQPNTFVDTRYVYGDLRAKIRLIREAAVRPHLGLGIGFFNFTPRDAQGRDLSPNASTRAPGETYGSTTAMFPITAGALWRVNRIVSIGLDYNVFFIASDYLDNVSQLGARSGNDWLHGLQLGAYFSFHPEIKRGKAGKSDLLLF
jgi:hypothetical protein